MKDELKPEDFLFTIRDIGKIYETILKSVCRKYDLTLAEAKVISVLSMYPQIDMAKEIAQVQMLTKSHVSQAVDSLIKKSLIQRKTDESDRRKVHLCMRQEALPITREIQQVKQQFLERIVCDFSEKEKEIFCSFLQRLTVNIKQITEKIKE